MEKRSLRKKERIAVRLSNIPPDLHSLSLPGVGLTSWVLGLTSINLACELLAEAGSSENPLPLVRPSSLVTIA